MLGGHGRRWIPVALVGLLVALAGAVVVWTRLTGSSWAQHVDVPQGPPPAELTAATEARIEAFCGNCHALPRPESFPRDLWHTEVLRGYEFYARSGFTHLDPPPVEDTVTYYRSRAPESFVFPQVADASHQLGTQFSVQRRATGQPTVVAPAVAHLRAVQWQSDQTPVLVVCDMRDGNIWTLDPNQADAAPQVLARLNNPCHAEPCDLDGDGTVDLVVADLGSSVPYDHALGRVVWLRRQGQRWETVVLAAGLGRVADVQPADLDADGDLDVVVADFGLHRTGQVLWLENQQDESGTITFRRHQVDPRPGAIHVPVVDLNQDGRLDFLGLISQEYECVEAYIQHASESPLERAPIFARKRLWTGPDLTFGSSGISPVDLDQDGDMDVLYSNGDAFDNNIANPSHGIQWLENVDGQQFQYHRLTDLTGACRALSGDLDLDGDLDILATVWLPEDVQPVSLRAANLPSIICLEQTEPGVFARHTIEAGEPNHAALEVADFDGDGDLDFAVGANLATTRPQSPWVTVYHNERK